MEDYARPDLDQLHREMEVLRRQNAELENAVREYRETVAFLRKSERKFRSLAENTPDGIPWAEAQEISRMGSSSYDFRTGKMEWSGTLYRILGVSPDTIPDMNLYQSLMHPDDREWLVDLQQSSLQAVGDLRYELEYRIVTPAGETRHLAVISHFTRDEQGLPFKLISVMQDITERKRIEEERERLIRELQRSLAEVKTLRGLIPICSHCKKIRDDSGYWQQIEKYVSAHSEASFTHGICPDCMTKYYPDHPCDKK